MSDTHTIAPALTASQFSNVNPPAPQLRRHVLVAQFTWVITTTRLPLSGLWEAVAVTEAGFTLCGRGGDAAGAMAAALEQVDAFEGMAGGVL